MSARRKKVAIIGAGICGVSSAICLQNADPSLELTIVAEKFSPNLTSDGGAGMWSSIPGFWFKETGKEKQRQWGKATFEYLKAILKTEEAYRYQMTFTTGYILFDHMMPEEPPLKDVTLNYKRLSKDDLRKLNFPRDLIDGFTMKTIMFPATPYLQMMLKRFQHNGGKVIQKKVKSFAEFAGKFDVVVNCTGLGARELCKDDGIEPARGHILRMYAPWIKHFFYIKRKKELEEGKATYSFPRFKDVVIGGTDQRGNWNTNIDERETQAILNRVAQFEPTIKNAEVITQWVGLRPFRDAVRLEKEVMDVKTQYGTKYKLQVVHNYGHGGAGLSLFWGCAEEVKDLVLGFLLQSGL